MKDISTIHRVDFDEAQEAGENSTTFLFHLVTLYQGKKMQLQWQRYDEAWGRFEKDHLTNPAPIPHSAQFLLIHLLMKHLAPKIAAAQEA